MESNDTLLTATQTGIDAGELGQFTFNGVIGDNPDTGDADDVDLYALEVTENTRIGFDIASGLSFDAILRVFDSKGNQLAFNDGVLVDFRGETTSDAFIAFRPPASGTYYVGVSGSPNSEYFPLAIGSGTNSSSTGNYDLTITTLEPTTSIFTGGAKLLKDINTGSPSSLGSLTPNSADFAELDGKLFFTANDGVTGAELWVSDGTADGTLLLKDIRTGGNSGFRSLEPEFTEFDGKLFFTANDGVTGNELWVSDGTADGTLLLKDINTTDGPDGLSSSYASNLTEFDGKLLFSANDGVSGNELWVSDGTADGTQLLKDIGRFSGLPGTNNHNFTEVDGKLFFQASDGVTGNELWVSDGTADGTQLLKDINTNERSFGAASSRPYDLTEFDGKLFFTANDGVTGKELWVSDGTADGTQLLKDINLVDSLYDPSRSYSSNFTEVDGKLFFIADDGVTGRELWVSDGTADGTQLLKDINTGSSSGLQDFNVNFTEFDGKLFFIADDGVTGNELWVSDGTTDGTQLLTDINLDDTFYSGPFNLTVAGDFLFFDARDGFTGQELWISDGTAAGTQLFQDIAPEGGNSDPGNLSVLGDQLFFSANDGTTGWELWTATIPDNLITGDENNNILIGTSDIDFINGLAGDDVIRGRRGNDLLNGGSGDDDLFGNRGDDTLNGNDGDDQLFGGRGNDSLRGGAGNDIVRGGFGDDRVIVEDFSGVDSFDGGSGNDRILFDPTDGRDLSIFLERGNVGDGRRGGQTFTNFKEIITGSGNDRLLGNNAANTLNGGDGNDEIRGGAGNDLLIGGKGNDELQGGSGDDLVEGGAGDDTVIVRDFNGVDSFDGGDGNDRIQFAPTDGRNLTIFLDRGGVGDGRRGGQSFTNFEEIITGRGDDRLLGNDEANILNGGEGDDELIGGLGADTLVGGQGADTFRFADDLLDGLAETDTIQDFESQDILDFSAYVNAGGSIGATRLTSESLRLDLSGEDAVDIFGSAFALNIAESQI